MELKANNGISENMFEVPCVVVDTLLKVASGTYIKVLLYILRCSGKDCTQKEIASNTGVSLQEAEDAVKFWQQTNVLSHQQENNILPPVFDMTPPAVQQIECETVPERPSVQKKEIIIRKQKQWTGNEILHMRMSDPDINELMDAVQSVLGTMNNMHTSHIVNMYQDLGMKKEVIMTLIGYCKYIDKTYPDYIYTIACQWVRDNINTFELAEKEVQRLKSAHDYMGKVMYTLQIDRLTEEQEKMIEDWHDWNITMDMVKFAYEISLPHCGNQLKLNYLKAVIKNWHIKGINTLQKAIDDNEEHKQKNALLNGRKDDSSDVDMYSICINNYEVI